MEIRTLRIFLSVAQIGSVSGAAKKLNYVQSNVTARIKQLEEEMGAALFIRKARGMSLTSEGKVLLKYAEKILYLSQQAVRAVDDSLNKGGELVVGCMETAAAIHLPQLLNKFHQEFNAVNITLLTGTSEEMVNKVLECEVDCAFVGGEVSHPEIVQQKILEEKLVLFAEQPIEMIRKGCDLTLLVFREGCSYRAHLEQWLTRIGIKRFRIMEFGTLDAILGCVEAGMGATLLPLSIVQKPQYAHFEIQKIPDEFAIVATSVIYHRDTAFTQGMKAFLRLVNEYQH